MPRKSSYTREQVASKALQMVREKGFERLSARSLGAALGCSSSPIFTLYSGMNEVIGEVRKLANKIFFDYMSDVMEYDRPYQEYSLRLMRFARKETNLFYFLFMQKKAAASYDIQPQAMSCLDGLKSPFGLTDDQVKKLFEQMWAFTCGLTVLSTKLERSYPEERVSEMLAYQFYSTLEYVKSGKRPDEAAPQRKTK